VRLAGRVGRLPGACSLLMKCAAGTCVSGSHAGCSSRRNGPKAAGAVRQQVTAQPHLTSLLLLTRCRPLGVTGDSSFSCVDVNEEGDAIALYNPARWAPAARLQSASRVLLAAMQTAQSKLLLKSCPLQPPLQLPVHPQGTTTRSSGSTACLTRRPARTTSTTTRSPSCARCWTVRRPGCTAPAARWGALFASLAA
jgi:hypothetical protein